MKRSESHYLVHWKNAPSRKPLIIRGARQVGKTWLMRNFGKSEYEKVAYVNFESNPLLKNLFNQGFHINQIILGIQIETGITIEAVNTLIIFDEIQEVPEAITSLKYFQENAPQYHIIGAGSLLGVALHQNTSFPVGKVEFLDLYPLTFIEFLEALGHADMVNLLQQKNWQLINSFASKYTGLLRQYYYIGGMPEAVISFSKNKDFSEVRLIQNSILIAYEQDFSKHASHSIVPRIRMLWNSIPAQLAKENKKFIYGLIRKGARAKEYELALAWLKDCGLIHLVHNVSKPSFPLKAYEEFNNFKIFMADVGLLGAMANLDVQTLIDGNTIFKEFKGALTEQYVLQQLITQKNLDIYYWSSENSLAEVDFLLQSEGEIIPLEVKAEENLQAKSLRLFSIKYHSKKVVRTSMANYRQENWMCNVPLYAVSFLL